ncbi:ATP synthase F1 subunit epsilon [Candidatus Uhrbacteria bacterium]|nr:ATP synthase F1 subunit epsilon [Candidatus Uhrbacteria bacterium]
MIQLSIITPERTVYDARVDQVTLPTTEGEITVLPHHISLVSVLAPGELRLKSGDEEIPMAIAGGFVEVLPTEKGPGPFSTRVAVLADDALRVEEMDVAAIEAARERARTALAATRHTDDVSFADAAAGLQKELARLKVARKYRRGGRYDAPESM